MDRIEGGAGAVAHAEGFGALGKTPFLARFDEGEAAVPAAQKLSGTRGVGEAGCGPGEEYQARFLITHGSGLPSRTTALAQDAGERRARKTLAQRWDDQAERRHCSHDSRPH